MVLTLLRDLFNMILKVLFYVECITMEEVMLKCHEHEITKGNYKTDKTAFVNIGNHHFLMH